jgi:hypothetical protein
MLDRKLCFFAAVLISLASILPAQASSKKGVVVYNKSGCKSRYVVETNMGYAILEWYGGNNPREGDVIVGDIDSYGFKNLYNVTRDVSLRVYVEDYMLGKHSLTAKFFEKFCS